MNTENLDRKIKWYFKNVAVEIDLDLYEVIKLSHFDTEGKLTLSPTKWRDFNEFR